MSVHRFLLAGFVLAASATSVSGQYNQQQRQDDLGIMSTPQSGQQSPSTTSGPVQQVSPLQTTPVHAPTITNNPDYPRNPIFVPTPYHPYQQYPGQFPQGQFPGQQFPQGQFPQQQGGQLRQQQGGQTQQPLQPGSEQRGRGTFTAPGVTRHLSIQRQQFQEFICASPGHVLPLYGYNLFEAPTTFAPVDNVPVTPEYVIGPGDELLVRACGQIEIDYRAMVDRNGMINIPRVGPVP